MTVKKIAEGAFFVPPFYSKNINSRVPGLVSQCITTDELEREDEITEQTDDLTKEEFENILKKIARPVRVQRSSKK